VLPQMNGRELAELLQRRRPRLKVLFVSGYIANVDLRDDLAEGLGDFLQKPFRLAELANRVREILDREAPEASGA
ncbi:MAG TPA: response regulator, partial [Thermoanaerobaculia bacterium]|nr:response regulator [Thermoanaerobaculia bacterium]